MRSVASCGKKEESMTNDDEAKTMMLMNDDEAEMKLHDDEEKTIMTTRLEEELMDGDDIGSPYELYWRLSCLAGAAGEFCERCRVRLPKWSQRIAAALSGRPSNYISNL